MLYIHSSKKESRETTVTTLQSPTTMTTMKSTSPTSMTTVKSSVEINSVDVEDQRKIKMSKWKPKFPKKTTPRKLEDDSYYPVPALRNNPGKHYVPHHLPPRLPLRTYLPCPCS